MIGKDRAAQMLGIDVAHAMTLQLEIAVDRTGRNVRMHDRTDVVFESGKRDFLGVAGAPDSAVPFEHQNRRSSAREVRGAGKAVVPCADDDEVLSHGRLFSSEFSREQIVRSTSSEKRGAADALMRRRCEDTMPRT